MDITEIFNFTGLLMLVVGLILVAVTPRDNTVVITGMSMIAITGAILLSTSFAITVQDYNRTHITQCTTTLIQENGNDN